MTFHQFSIPNKRSDREIEAENPFFSFIRMQMWPDIFLIIF